MKPPRTLVLAAYPCEDYAHSDFAHTGFYDEISQFWIVVPLSEAEEPVPNFLRIGGPGVDGISFGYRVGFEGLWAHYPIENRFTPVAASITELVTRWTAGELKV